MTTTRPPTGLSSRSRKLWTATLDSYELSDAEMELLRLALVALDRADEAAKLVAAEGLTATDRYGGVRAHPAVGIESRCRSQFAAIVRQLGINVTAGGSHVRAESAASRKARRAAYARWNRPA